MSDMDVNAEPPDEDKAWELEDAERAHAESPETFLIPSVEERASLQKGALVKLIVLIEQDDDELGSYVQGERLYVRIIGREADRYKGRLEDGSVLSADLARGSHIIFGRQHIATIVIEGAGPAH